MSTSLTGVASDPTAGSGAAVWNAIASIKSTSPFDDGSDTSTSSVAGEFDSLIDHSAADALDGDTSSATLDPAASTTATSGMSASDLALLRQIQNAESSTIDLFA
jgi:hypothetical protein